MLARRNRVTSGADYRTIVRRGRRTTTGTAVVSALAGPADAPTRFGFIVSKKVGNAVTRNLVRRRLKAVSAGLLDSLPPGTSIVIRVLPGMERTAWDTLQEEMASAVTRAVRTI
ncbi:ribonuclease P protein component [Clavibacter phaseoli]|uniref:ribonuclease P protein component n=1 Tax=Clavibacter phaseoli TaxID=1734031 RepID=UPI000E66A366|nr:ribonuclease P protein component [Clavibacter phaseoli]RIJ58287.1 ribonuclease P protein component [Clavibacter phaseoli]UKF32037.1 ribonuclease P protein component [Clavibacter phaseoli]UKF37959.1 ribonuclease P protein component [Clavibacter phaseoli]